MMEPGPRIIRAWRIRIEDDLKPDRRKNTYSFILSGAIAPITLSICSEARRETLRRRRYTVVTDNEKSVYIDFNRDVIYIQERRILSFKRKEINVREQIGGYIEQPGRSLPYFQRDYKYHSMHDALRRAQRLITGRSEEAITNAVHFAIRNFLELKVMYTLPTPNIYFISEADFQNMKQGYGVHVKPDFSMGTC